MMSRTIISVLSVVACACGALSLVGRATAEARLAWSTPSRRSWRRSSSASTCGGGATDRDGDGDACCLPRPAARTILYIVFSGQREDEPAAQPQVTAGWRHFPRPVDYLTAGPGCPLT